MVDDPSHQPQAPEAGSASQDALPDKDGQQFINFDFFNNIPETNLSFLVIATVVSLWLFQQVRKCKNNFYIENSKEDLQLHVENFEQSNLDNSDENQKEQNKRITSVAEIAKGTALVVDYRYKSKVRATAFLAKIRLQKGLYPALFTAGHLIFPDIKKMEGITLKDIKFIFSNINGKENIENHKQQQKDVPIQIEVWTNYTAT